MWRSEEQGRQASYDCSHCIARGLKAGRVCYKYDPINTLNVPKLFDETGNPVFEENGEKIPGAFSPLKCNKEEAIKIFASIASKQPTRPVFDIWYSYFRRYIGLTKDENGKLRSAEVCPIGFLTEEAEDYISMENAASKYNSLPHEGSWLDQPLHIIQAFEAIQIAIGHFERDRINKMRSESRKNKQNQGK